MIETPKNPRPEKCIYYAHVDCEYWDGQKCTEIELWIDPANGAPCCREREEALHVDNDAVITHAIAILQRDAYDMALDKGFHPAMDMQDRAVVHLEKLRDEVHELISACAMNNPPSDKIPGYSSIAEEASDIIILLANWLKSLNINLGRALLAKLTYNSHRPYRHGKAIKGD